jgi:hypothetical protein
MAFTTNLGHMPDDCIVLNDVGGIAAYKKVRVMLFRDEGLKQARDREPWPAGPQTVWKIDEPPHPFQIRRYEVV